MKNENTAVVDTFEQSVVNKNSRNIAYAPFFVNMMNPDGDFSKNDIDIKYYRDPTFSNVSSHFAYANEEKPIMIGTDFFWGSGNDFTQIQKYSNFTCRFTSVNDPIKVMITDAIMEVSPIGQFRKDKLPDQVRCRTPKWDAVDSATLEFSINGHDYLGNFAFSFVDNLEIYKISPLSGPINGATVVKIYGTGYTSSNPQEVPLYVKFGTVDAKRLDKSEAHDYSWVSDEYYDDFNIPKALIRDAEVNDKTLVDSQSVKKYVGAITPDIHQIYSYDTPDVFTYGGPVFVQVGERVPIKITEHNPAKAGYKGPLTEQIDVAYPVSSNLEFYFYREPIVKKIEPTSGLTSGGTNLELTGLWFDYQPQYGVMPFCKIGSSIVRAKFVTTNRVICKTPPSNDITVPSPVEVSLNG